MACGICISSGRDFGKSRTTRTYMDARFEGDRGERGGSAVAGFARFRKYIREARTRGNCSRKTSLGNYAGETSLGKYFGEPTQENLLLGNLPWENALGNYSGEPTQGKFLWGTYPGGVILEGGGVTLGKSN